MLPVKMQVSFSNIGGVCLIIFYTFPSQAVTARAISLGPAYGSVNRNVGNVDAFRHEFSCHALGKARFTMAGHGESAALGITFECRAGVCKDDGASVPFIADGIREHAPGCLLPD